jgi:hypothetical protein
MRITPQVRERLVTEAERHGRSLTQEAEYRLEQSFGDDDVVAKVLSRACGPELTGLLLLLAVTLRDAGAMAGFNQAGPRGYHDWFNLPLAYDQVASAINVAVEAIRPNGGLDRLKSALPALPLDTADSFEVPIDQLGAASMLINLRAVVDPANAPRNIRAAAVEVSQLLGPAITDRIAQNLAEVSK